VAALRAKEKALLGEKAEKEIEILERGIKIAHSEQMVLEKGKFFWNSQRLYTAPEKRERQDRLYERQWISLILLRRVSGLKREGRFWRNGESEGQIILDNERENSYIEFVLQAHGYHNWIAKT
jgi:hypothetical protein